MYCASSSANFLSTWSLARTIRSGSGIPRARNTLAIPRAVSSIAFTSTPRCSAHLSMLSSKRCLGSPYTSSDVPAMRKRLGVEVVRGEMIAARHGDAGEIALLARHSVQRLDRAHHGQVRHELVVGIHEQLRPRPVDWHRFDRFAVGREATVLDDAASFEQAN